MRALYVAAAVCEFINGVLHFYQGNLGAGVGLIAGAAAFISLAAKEKVDG